MFCCPLRLTRCYWHRHSRRLPTRAKPCLVSELPRCSCSSWAFTTRGTALPILYLSRGQNSTASRDKTKVLKEKSDNGRPIGFTVHPQASRGLCPEGQQRLCERDCVRLNLPARIAEKTK